MVGMPRVIPFRRDSASADLTLWGDGTATLSSLYAKEPRKGHSTALMHQIGAYADEHNLVLFLTARRFGNPRGLDNESLVKFYEKFGFTAQFKMGIKTHMVRQIGAKGVRDV